MGFVDIHQHVVYGVDDGPRSAEESLEMLRLAQRDGVTHIIATSHAYPAMEPFPAERYLRHLGVLRQACRDEGIAVSISAGCEIFYSDVAIRQLQERRIPTLADTSCVLVEFDPLTPWEGILDAVRKLSNRGYRTVVAHCAVSYTHLDVYKRQETDRLFRSLMEVCEEGEGCPEAAGRARLCAGSYESARRLAALSPSGEWLRTVRRLLPYVEKAIDEQRRFIRAHREVVRVDRAKRVTSETVRHLAQHSEYITRVDRDGSVQPDRLLTVERDENYAIYENRFLYTLVTHLESFLAQQAREMKETDGTLSYTYRLAQAGREGAFQLEGRIDRLPGPGGQGAFSEVEDLRKQAARLMDSPLMRLLVGTAPVRYPVVRTNLIKKNPNFQKAMELYEFLIAHQDGLIAVSFGEAPGQAAPEAAGAMGALAALAQAGAPVSYTQLDVYKRQL